MISIAKKHFVFTASCILVVAGLLNIAGWYFHVPKFTYFFPGAKPLPLNGGVCVLLSGSAIFLINKENNTRSERILSKVFCWIILLTGLLTFQQYFTSFDPGIDHVLYRHSAKGDELMDQHRMSMPTSFKFFLLGLCLLLLPKRKYHSFIHISSILIIISSLLTLLNYLCGTVYFEKTLEFYAVSPLASASFIVACWSFYMSRHFAYFRLSFHTRIGLFFALVMLVLAFFFVTMRNMNTAVEQTTREVDKTEELLANTEGIHIRLEILQNNIKNYMLLGTQTYYNEYTNNADTLRQLLTELQNQQASGTVLIDKTASLTALLSDYIRSRDSIMAGTGTIITNTEVIRKIVEDGKIKTDKARELLQGIKTNARQVEKKLRQQKLINLQISGKIIGLSQLFAFLFLIAAFYMIFRNTRSRDKAEAALDKSEKFLKSVINNSSNPVAIRDIHGRYLLVNKHIEEFTGLSAAEITGKTVWEIHPRELAEKAIAADTEVIKNKKVIVEEITIPGGDEQRSYVISRFPITDEQNNLYAIGTIATEVTALKKAKEMLENFMHFFNNSNDLCVICDMKNAFENMNATTLHTLGYTHDEMQGKSFIDFAHPDDILYIIRTIEKSKASGNESINFSRRFLQKNGGYIWINWKATPDPVTQKIFAIGRDITEQKILETKLKQFNQELEKKVEEKSQLIIEKESQYRFLLENMREGIQVLGHDWKYLFVNNSVVGHSRYGNEKELLGYTIMEKYPGVEHTALFQVMKDCMENRTEALIENKFEYPDGTVAWFELSIQPVPEGIFILSSDITSRKKAEDQVKNSTEELKKSNAELERFAYIASHDLQEPLRMISSFLNLLQRRLDNQLDETAKQYMFYVTDGADRMKSLINDLLEYSRVGSHNEAFGPTDPMECLNYVRRLLNDEITRSDATINVLPMPVITASKTLFSQLLVNLISNALKYHGDKKPVIEVGCQEQPGEYLFHVRDNGEGIDPKFFNKIFIIFQRLHSKGEHAGTGIGLAICKKIVEVHKGKIWVESEVGKGSTFYFTISKNAT